MAEVQVQVQVETRVERQILTLKGANDDAVETSSETESSVKTHRAKDAEFETIGGFQFQRCGGGRRVIRRSRGGY